MLGVWIPYWPLYLKSLNLDAAAIGLLMALGMWVRVAFLPLWGRLADRGVRNRVAAFTAWASVIGFLSYYPAREFIALVAATVLFSLFHAGPLALVEATTMETVVRSDGDYGRIRLWGSLGFLLFASGLGMALDRWGLILVFWSALTLLAGSALLTLRLPSTQDHSLPGRGGERFPWHHPGLRWFFLSCALMQFSHGAYYGFMSIHLEQNGFSRTAIGALWAVGVVAEVLVMIQSRSWLRRFNLSAVLAVSLALAALRWGIYSATLWLPLLIFGQMLHAFTFGTFHIAGVRRTFEAVPERDRASGQAWYAALSFGVGGGIGLLAAGRIQDAWGAQLLFQCMALAALAGLVASLISSRHFGVTTEPVAAGAGHG